MSKVIEFNQEEETPPEAVEDRVIDITITEPVIINTTLRQKQTEIYAAVLGVEQANQHLENLRAELSELRSALGVSQ